MVRHFFDRTKPVAHLCHASIALANAGVLDGRRIAAYPELASDVQRAGAEFVNAEVVIDGAMISARAYPDHPAFMREFFRLLRATAPAELPEYQAEYDQPPRNRSSAGCDNAAPRRRLRDVDDPAARLRASPGY